MNILKKIWLLLFVAWACIWIYFIQQQHFEFYKVYSEKEKGNPQALLDGTMIKNLSFGYSKLFGDKYWIDTILYAGDNAAKGVYKKALYQYIKVVTDISPKFFDIYPFSQILLLNFDVNKSLEIWLKWMQNNCDQDKLLKIDNDKDILQVKNIKIDDKKWIILNDDFWKNNQDIINPCKTFELPYYIAYAYLIDLKDYPNALKYMKYAMLHEDAVWAATGIAFNLVWKVDSYAAGMQFWKDSLDLAKKNNAPDDQIQDLETKFEKITNLYMINEGYKLAKSKNEKFDLENPYELEKHWYVDSKYLINPDDIWKTNPIYIYHYDKQTKLFESILKSDQ